jgi:hypothetical protein
VTPQDFLTEAERRLSGAKFSVTRGMLPPGESVVAQRKPFRVRWMLTQLKTTVLVTATETATGQGWESFVRGAFELAKGIEGGMPTGFQSGIGAVPVLVANVAEPEAVAAAAQRPQYQWFRGIAMPALVELSSGRVTQYDGRIMVGAIYVPFLRKQRDLVTSIVRH